MRTLEIQDLCEKIESLNLDEARSLLFQLILNMKMLREADIDSTNIKEELSRMYDRVLNHIKLLEKEKEIPYEWVHLVSGESAAGSVRVAFGRKDKVIGLPDHLAAGPIWQFHQEKGRQHRYEWLINHMLDPEDYLERQYERRLQKALQEISEIHDDAPIIIWTGENAFEQTTLRFYLYLLRDKQNPLYVINSTKEFSKLFNTAEMTYDVRHSGEISPEKFQEIYKHTNLTPLSIEERRTLEIEWLKLAETKEVLRVWQDGEIKSVEEDYFDEFILETMRRLHQEFDSNDFMKSARLIGEVIGHCEEPIGDEYIEYRVRKFVYDGVFEMKGVPKGMRFYSIRLRSLGEERC